MAWRGITATAPMGLPQKPKLPPISPIGPKVFVQLDPIGQAGAAPTSHNKRTTLLSTESNTPVKPEPDRPPERVKMVTVLPMLSHRESKMQFDINSIVFPPFQDFLSLCFG